MRFFRKGRERNRLFVSWSPPPRLVWRAMTTCVEGREQGDGKSDSPYLDFRRTLGPSLLFKFFLRKNVWKSAIIIFCCCLVAQSCQTLCNPWTAARQASLSFTISQSLLKLVSIELMMPSNYLILCCPLLLLPSVFPSIRVFSNVLTCRIRWPKYWSFSISPSNEYSGLISFRVDWLDLRAVHGTLKSLLQHHRSTASILQHSAFIMVQLSHLYMTTGKTIALTRWTFIGKVISLLFNTLSRFAITFPPSSKHLLISWQ